ncbi:MAG: hypothetical protein K2M05_01180 [Paramuribaculum sp.]|nr:hypothetical protein [Paramuribaculum sp.]
MKKFTLFASMLLAGVSSLFAATDFLAKPEITTDEANPITYCIINYRGDCYSVKGDSTMTAMAAQDYGMSSIMTPYIDETAIWYFTDAGDGGVYINNVGIEGTIDGTQAILLDLGEGAPYYILENGVNNCGLAISIEPTLTTGVTCIDAANHSAVLSPGWSPRPGDWQGTCWIFVKVDGNDMDAAQEACEAVYREVHPSPEVILAAKIKAAIDTALAKVNLYIGISPWTDELFKDFPARIKAIPTTDTTLEDVQAAIEEVMFDAEDATFDATDIIAENLPGKSFTLQSSRRFGLDRNATYLGAGKRMHYEIEDGDTIGQEEVDIFYCYWMPENETYSYCVWTAEESEDGGIYLYNVGSKTYLSWETLGFGEASALILPAESVDDAQTFAFEFVDNAYPGIAFYNENSQGVNVDTRNAALPAPAVYYNYQDGGSTWRIALVDVNSVENVAADKVVNGEGAVEMFTISGQQVNPATAAPGLYIRRQGDVVTKVLVK